MSEQLSLLGAISLLESSIKKLPKSEWKNGYYYETTPAEKEAYNILLTCSLDCYKEYKNLLKGN